MTKLSAIRKNLAYHLSQPAVQLLARTPITPSTITWFGFLLAVGAATLIFTEHLVAAGFLVLASGFLDMLDGALARRTNQVTHFGAILDSTLDRLSEAMLLLSIIVLYANTQSLAGVLLTGIALISSQLVSYIRARAEAIGLECQVGLFTRPERVLVLALGLFLSQIADALLITMAIIVVFSLFTAGQRLVYVWWQVKTR
jgi:CDP-diacylglycerol--glycerol-3-phosphate 3-phosphatidyltransferase